MKPEKKSCCHTESAVQEASPKAASCCHGHGATPRVVAPAAAHY